jgi:putative ABC transport system permease protein
MRPGAWLGDLRIGFRGLRRRPAFTMAAVATLALGIGANTAVFSVIQHVLLAPMPYRDADRVAVIWSKWRGFDKTWVSDAEVLDYRKRIGAFEGVGAWQGVQVNVTGDGDPVRIGAALITPNLFNVLGVQPLSGRGFTDAEAAVVPSTVVIVSHTLWQHRFGGDDVLGRTIHVNGVAREIVGVMPPGFKLPTDYVQDAEEPTQLWAPYQLNPGNRGSHGMHAAARLRPDATFPRANAELLTLTRQLTDEQLYPVPMQFSAFAVSATDEAVAAVRPALWLVFGAVACLLLIACANVANLLLVRGEGRMREMAVRAALGADRRRLVRQLVAEGALLAALATAAGIGLAWIALRVLVAADATTLPRVETIGLDWRVLGFAAVLSLVTLLLFALIPAWRTARVDLVDSLKDGSQNASAGERKQRLRGMLVVAEVAVALVLLTGAGLMLRSLWNLQRIDLGFSPDRVLTMRLALPATQYDTPEKVNDFYGRLLAKVRTLSGVETAGLVRLLPLAAPIGDWGLTIEGFTPPPGVSTPGDWQVATAGGPEALGERLLAGRWLAETDTIGALDVALVNEVMAQKYWPGQDALGRRFRMGPPTRPWITVVGIVGNVRHNGVTAEVKPKFYRAHGQFHQSSGNPQRNMSLVVKTAGDPAALAPTIRAEIRGLDGSLPIAAIRPMQQIVNTSIATPRLTGALLASFASLAVLLAAIGIYGVLSYVVSERRQEIGIRMAIGAGPARVMRLFVGQGVIYALIGVAVGIAASAAASRLIASLLHDVTPLDAATFAAAPVLLLTVAVIASIIPAWRATRVDPLRAMRAD